MDHVPGTTYLLHFDRPYKHAQHWARDLDARLAQHADGTGARLLQVARANGIGWQLARTWPGNRYRERQLKNQGGRSRMCPVCKHAKQAAQEATMQPMSPARRPQASQTGDEIRAELPAGLTSARHARAAVRQALLAWGMTDPAGDAELLASELVANAAEHGSGPISFALRRQAVPGGQAGICCEITDTSPRLPRPRDPQTDEERGRGLAIITTLATASGVRTEPPGKTAWFTLALRDRIEHAARQPEPDLEAEAGA
jgi:anti-sigma regulatory factor (Ser/Thr protein kinase)